MSYFLDKPETINLGGMVRRLKGVQKRKIVPGIFWDNIVDYTEWQEYEVGQDFVFNADHMWFNKKFVKKFKVHIFKTSDYNDLKNFLLCYTNIKEDIRSFWAQNNKIFVSKIYVLQISFDRDSDMNYVFIDKRKLGRYIKENFGVKNSRSSYYPLDIY